MSIFFSLPHYPYEDKRTEDQKEADKKQAEKEQLEQLKKREEDARQRKVREQELTQKRHRSLLRLSRSKLVEKIYGLEKEIGILNQKLETERAARYKAERSIPQSTESYEESMERVRQEVREEDRRWNDL